ncbi:DUF1194 domain-containing protein [Oceaniglobus ichthyenteri]|uniref:DUF1194 domain-containing protein n=1 Tax=Oceaniglobus ichthyenteri TaxID=2136177 RepID=UPI000D3D23DE|nr:DUF1194 domain-containing protein [Oceaniglobus ichthyenteri]
MRHLIALLLLLCPLSAPAQEVDVELLLMVDVSRSMSGAELEIQRRGYIEALLSPTVMSAIHAGLLGRVAIAYVEWAGVNSQTTIVDWTMIAGEDDARDFVEKLSRSIPVGLRRTSISGALEFGAQMIARNTYQGLRRVIDMSGDGPNNQGRNVTDARDRVLDQGIVINGLPLMTRDGVDTPWHLEDLDEYYVNCVIGGPGAFAIPVTHWAEFAEAVRRKLVLELVGLPSLPPIRARTFGATPTGYDCEIGEKMWQRNFQYWQDR